MKNIGLFFGAGAEISYGLPSGGSFALDIFRQDFSKSRDEFKEILRKIPADCPYAKEWLPKEFKNKKLYTFGASDYKNILETTLKSNRKQMTKRLNDFDKLISENRIGKNFKKIIKDKYMTEVNKEFGFNYGKKIKVNKNLKDQVKIFKSKYFSAIIYLIKKKDDDKDYIKKKDDDKNYKKLENYLIAFLQLLLGASGYELTEELNTKLFVDKSKKISILSEIADIFKIDISNSGLKAIELVMNPKNINTIDPNKLENYKLVELLTYVCAKSLESLFIQTLDYQELIDSHYKYLFTPKDDWAKFTKMVIFLLGVQELMKNKTIEINLGETGYYDDLSNVNQYKLKIQTIGTANYTNLIKEKLNNKNPKYLNGSLDDYFDPYNNSFGSKADLTNKNPNHILVPFIFTQSGIKPITSVIFLKRYVDFYEKLKTCDAIIVCGYGFNDDDSHINGIFRELVEENNKKLFLVTVGNLSSDDLGKKLRLNDTSWGNLQIIKVDKERKTDQKEIWLQDVSENLNKKVN